MKLRILVIITGGTIGSTVKGDYISPHGEKPYKIIEAYRAAADTAEIEFATKVPYLGLSENLTGESVGALLSCVKESLQEDYDGIIVTHGTDTLQYSAAAAGYLTGAATVPVIFVSSNYVLEDARANGLPNFSAAVAFIREKQGKGTFISYRNRDGITYLHRAGRALPQLPYGDEIFSMFGQYYGCYQKGKFQKNAAYQALPDSWQNAGDFDRKSFSTGSSICRIFPYPGMCYQKNVPECRAILLDTYHSGTICNLTEGMENFFEQAYEKKIPVYRVGASAGMDYESIKELEHYHIRTLPQISPVAAYMKLWFLLDEREELLFQSRGEDIVPS